MSIGGMGGLKNNRGVSTIEMAIVLIVLLLMVFGITEFGRAFYQYNTLAKTIRDGGRYIIKQKPADLSGEKTNPNSPTKNLVVYGNSTGTGAPLLSGLTTGKVEIVYTGAIPQYITVRIQGYQFQSLVPGIIPFTVNLSPEITMPYLFSP